MNNIRKCTNCDKEYVDESKQTFTYRNYMGNKCDSGIAPICDLCIETGEYIDEDGQNRLYLGRSRVPKDDDMYWGW